MKASTRPSSAASRQPGSRPGSRLWTSGTAHAARAMPTRAPRTATTPHSSTSRRRSRAGAPPSAILMPSSRFRSSARARKRCPTLAHASSSTRATVLSRSVTECPAAGGDGIGCRDRGHGPPCVGLRMLPRESRGQQVELGGGVAQRGTRSETPENIEPPLGAGGQLGGVEGQGIPQGHRGVVREAESRRHHADDLVRNAVERERAPDRSRITTQPADPEGVAHHHHAVASRRLLLRQKSASQRRGNAERPKEIGRGPHRGELLRLAVGR